MNKAVIRTGQALKQELTAVNNGCTSIHEGRQMMIPAGTTIPYQVTLMYTFFSERVLDLNDDMSCLKMQKKELLWVDNMEWLCDSF